MLGRVPLVQLPELEIAGLQISPSRRRIRGREGEVSVEPLVMQLLMLLTRDFGKVVERRAIFDELWGAAEVGDDSLNRVAALLRRALTAAAGQSVAMETVPRTGYRLVEQSAVEAVPVEDVPVADQRWPRRRVLGALAAGSALAAGGGALYWAQRPTAADPVTVLIHDSQVAMRLGTPASTRRAIALLQRAVELAPSDANAWGLLALTRARADEHAIDKTISTAGAIEIAANRALQLDPANADASAALAIAIPYYGDWHSAERRLDAVLKPHPAHLAARDSRAFLLGAVGRMREGARDRLAFPGDAPPDASFHYRLIYALWFLGRTAEADRAAIRGMEIWPGNPGIWFGRLWVLAGTGRFERALAHIGDVQPRPPLPQAMIDTLRSGIIAAQSQRPADIELATRQVWSGVARSVAAVVNAMMLFNLMNAVDAAFELARAYYLEQGPVLAALDWRPGQPLVPDQRRRKTNMLFTPSASAMQRDPRFMPLMEEMGLTEYWRRRGVIPDFLEDLRRVTRSA